MSGDQLDLGASFATGDPERHSGSADAGNARQRCGVSDLVAGSTVETVFLLSSKETRTTKAGKPYLKLKLSDRSGSVDCMVWDD